MPKHIEKALTKITRDFIWEENETPRIVLNYLHYQPEEGGLGLLDLEARNEAIEIIWLKSYLNLTTARPKWAVISDIIIDTTAPQGPNAQARINTFLQTWDAPTRGPHVLKLNDGLKRMLNTVRTYNANLTVIKLSPELKQSLPAWFQTGAEHQPINNQNAKCLLHKHKTRTIADLLITSARIKEAPGNQHRPTNFCNCTACREDNTKGCMHPHNCTEEALTRINITIPKLNPLNPNEHQDNLSLMR